MKTTHVGTIAWLVLFAGACAPTNNGALPRGQAIGQVAGELSPRPDSVPDRGRSSPPPGSPSRARNDPDSPANLSSTYKIIIDSAPGTVPGFPGGSEPRVERLTWTTDGRVSTVARDGSYWGSEMRGEDSLRSTDAGWKLVRRIEHHRRQSTGTWERNICAVNAGGPLWPTRTPVESAWDIALHCDATHIVERIRVEFTGTSQDTFDGERHHVILLRSAITRSHDPPQPVEMGSSTLTERVSTTLGLPLSWKRVYRDPSGRVIRIDRATLDRVEGA